MQSLTSIVPVIALFNITCCKLPATSLTISLKTDAHTAPTILHGRSISGVLALTEFKRQCKNLQDFTHLLSKQSLHLINIKEDRLRAELLTTPLPSRGSEDKHLALILPGENS